MTTSTDVSKANLVQQVLVAILLVVGSMILIYHHAKLPIGNFALIPGTFIFGFMWVKLLPAILKQAGASEGVFGTIMLGSAGLFVFWIWLNSPEGFILNSPL